MRTPGLPWPVLMHAGAALLSHLLRWAQLILHTAAQYCASPRGSFPSHAPA